MKNKNLTVILAFCFGTVLPLKAQGTFQNLDFESADLSPIPPGQLGGEVPISLALPGWNGSIGGVAVTEVLQNNYTITSPSIDILGPAWNITDPGIIGGNYTVFLESLAPPGSAAQDASISQTATVPNGVESLQLKAWSAQSEGQFTVSFNGNVLSGTVLSTGQSASGQSYTLYGFDIAPYAGDSGPLQITTTVPGGNGLSQIEFDDITFSTTTVPEPNPFALTGVGGLLFALYRRLAPASKR